MTQAYYAKSDLSHFGLNLRKYTHFTSPIRRYADLIVHRALIAAHGWDKDISTKVGDYIRGLGFKNFRDPVVHSLGLEHTDDPKLVGAQPGSKPDQVLEANMVINVDMPFTEIGWGSVHMEDTVLITDNGFERLSKSDFGLRIST